MIGPHLVHFHTLNNPGDQYRIQDDYNDTTTHVLIFIFRISVVYYRIELERWILQYYVDRHLALLMPINDDHHIYWKEVSIYPVTGINYDLHP